MEELSKNLREKLRKCGIRTVLDLLTMPPAQLVAMAAIPYKEAVELRRVLLHRHASVPVTAAALWTANTHSILPTGVSQLDQLLDGGISTGQLTEFCGPPGSGKTQIAHCIAGMVAMTTNSTVAYVDPGASFNPLILQNTLDKRSLSKQDVDLAAGKIRVYSLYSVFELLALLADMKENIPKMDDYFLSNLRLIVVDPVTPLLTPVLGSRHSHGHVIMGQLVQALRELATEHGIAILYTNNMVLGVAERRGLKPALGRSWSHVPNSRIELSNEQHQIVASVTKSQTEAVGVSVTFSLSSSGPN